MKQRLIELINAKQDAGIYETPGFQPTGCTSNEELADYLLTNGVIVPPVSVGDTMWVLSKDLTTIQSVVITDVYCRWHKMGVSVSLVTDNPFAYLFDDYEIGMKIFFTEENAKKVLEERNKK